MKKVGQSSFIVRGLSHEPVDGSASHKPARNWRDGLEFDCTEVSEVALNLAKDAAGDFAQMLRGAAEPFL